MKTRNIKTDILVVGGGTAGSFAAISAARMGAKTLLIEKTIFWAGRLLLQMSISPDYFLRGEKR